MRLARIEVQGSVRIAARIGNAFLPLPYRDFPEAMAANHHELKQAVRLAKPIDATVRVLAPVAPPAKLLFAGFNYKSHLDENPSAVWPTEPFVFAKLPSSVINPGDHIVLPDPSAQVDYEVELALVVGHTLRRTERRLAIQGVFGYTVVNDVSARNIQFKDHQITLGKGCDTFCPIGPDIVTADEVPHPESLRLTTHVNGEERQSGSTSEMIFDIAALLEFVTRNVTLRPGDIVATGTPAGVGAFRQPPTYLSPGDEVRVEVDGVGSLVNRVVAGW